MAVIFDPPVVDLVPKSEITEAAEKVGISDRAVQARGSE